MWEKKYLCDLTILDSERMEEYIDRGFQCLDQERKKKLTGKKPGKNYLLSMSAGLLLQKAVADYKRDVGLSACKKVEEEYPKTEITLDLDALLEGVEKIPTEELSYYYGEQGKPYLVDYPFYFNISHSGDCVLLVAAEKEIGVDLQLCGGKNTESVARRFFSVEEREKLESLSSEEEKQEYFYRLWTQKEAYGKLTGEGILKVVEMQIEPLEEHYLFKTQRRGNYYMCICRKAEMDS